MSRVIFWIGVIVITVMFWYVIIKELIQCMF
jgi:hypothetical protein